MHPERFDMFPPVNLPSCLLDYVTPAEFFQIGYW